MQCPNCRYLNAPGAERCANCNAELPKGPPVGSGQWPAPVAPPPPGAFPPPPAAPSAWPSPTAGGPPIGMPPPLNPMPFEPPIPQPPYKQSGKVTRAGLIGLLVGLPVIGFIGGYGWNAFCRNNANTMFGKEGLLTGVFAGLIVFGAIWGIAVATKVRNRYFVALVTALACTLAFGVRVGLHAVDPAVHTRVELDNALESAMNGQATSGVLSAHIAPSGMVPASVDYIHWLSSGHLYTTNSYGARTPETGFSFWLDFLLPLFGVLCVVAIPLAGPAKMFCEKCDRWYRENTIFTVGPEQLPMVHAMTVAGDWPNLTRIPTSLTYKSNCSLVVNLCPQCGDARVSVRKTENSKTSTVFFGSVSPEVGQRLGQIRASMKK